ncbi:MAG: electron transfer flavoprotein subunit alpha [Lachnospiraceae bacterium]|nr:electron transfer flavoprotein subunit alpha [Lachnospiraceae bacterium]
MAELYFDMEKCTHCGQCAEQCPFGALTITEDEAEINASCRMCKLCIKACPEQAVSLVEEEQQVALNKDDWKGILVFVEQETGGVHPVAYELLGKAQELAGKVNHPVYAVLIGGEDAGAQADHLASYGADRVYVYSHPELEHYRGDVYTNVMEDCINRIKPAVVLVGATSLGRSLAPACATRFRTGLTADCTGLDIKENTDLVQTRPAFGGNIMAQILTTHTRPQFATVRYKVMSAAKREDAAGEVVECEVTPEMLRSGIEVEEAEVIERTKAIEEEDVLVVAGRGVKKQEDMEMLRELAKLLGGQLATTRPLVEKGWGDVTTQIGLSGRTVKPKLIITCGISGAVQFTAAMNGSECIVAINTDPNAPIFSVANYCIVKDLYEVVPELIGAVEERRKQD